MIDKPAIKHSFVFVSDDGNDRQEFVIDPGTTVFFYPKQTAMYTLHPGGERFAMIANSSHIVINSPDQTPDIWGNEPRDIDVEAGFNAPTHPDASAALAQSDVEPVAWQSQVRHEVAAFALLMECELRNNDHKSGWKEDSPDMLAQRAIEEATELLAIASSYDAVALSPVPKQTAERVASEAADVANMAMMVADVCGALPLIPPHPEPVAWRKKEKEKAEVGRSQNLIVSYMGANNLLVHQISTAGGLNLSFEEAKELIRLFEKYV